MATMYDSWYYKDIFIMKKKKKFARQFKKLMMDVSTS